MDSVRLSSTLEFRDTEKDIYEFVRKLADRHKLGEFIGCLIRNVHDNPDILRTGSTGELAYSDVMKITADKGITPGRLEYLKEINNEILALRESISKLSEIVNTTYSLGLVGNRLGIEDKSSSSAVATFLMDRNLREIEKKLGINRINIDSFSDEKEKAKEKAEQTLEYILNSYSEVFDELKKAVSVINTVQVTEFKQTEVKEEKPVIHAEQFLTEKSNSTIPVAIATPVTEEVETAGVWDDSNLDLLAGLLGG